MVDGLKLQIVELFRGGHGVLIADHGVMRFEHGRLHRPHLGSSRNCLDRVENRWLD